MGPKGQNHLEEPREPNKTIFPLSFRHWVWILHKNSKFWSSSTNFGCLGSNLGQNRPQKVQKVPIGLERKIRPFFHMVLVTEYESWTKIANFCSQGSILGQNWVKIGPKCPKSATIGVYDQMIPFFNSVSGTEYEFCFKIPNFGHQVPILNV